MRTRLFAFCNIRIDGFPIFSCNNVILAIYSGAFAKGVGKWAILKVCHEACDLFNKELLCTEYQNLPSAFFVFWASA